MQNAIGNFCEKGLVMFIRNRCFVRIVEEHFLIQVELQLAPCYGKSKSKGG